jgi:hypothetical protein
VLDNELFLVVDGICIFKDEVYRIIMEDMGFLNK